MFEEWTRQRVIGLAPDASSAKAGDGLGKSSKWSTLGYSNSAIWGEIKGSGKRPYQVRIDLSEPAFKCSCPSRKFPCKHALGLMLVLADEASTFKLGDPPEWVADWLAQREKRSEQREQRAKEKADKQVDPKAQAKRAARRDQRIRSGIEETATWLADVMRSGLAAAQNQPGNYWQHATARLVDAQAPGLVRYIRQMSDAIASGERWQERFLDAAGRLHLAIEAYRRLETLPPDMQDDVRSVAGLTTNTDELIATQQAVHARWLVLGQVTEQEEHLQIRRSWLVDQNVAGRVALILDFAAGSQVLDTSLVPGTSFEGELVYYPGRRPLRALIKSRDALQPVMNFPAGDMEQAMTLYSSAISASPWVDRWPMSLDAMSLQVDTTREPATWFLRDDAGRCLPISQAFRTGWTALSITGARPCRIFGEWDGRCLLPLAIQTEQVVYITGTKTSAGRWERASA